MCPWERGEFFGNSLFRKNRKTYKTTERKRNPQRGLVQGSNDDKRNHYSHLFSHGGVVLSDELKEANETSF